MEKMDHKDCIIIKMIFYDGFKKKNFFNGKGYWFQDVKHLIEEKNLIIGQ